MAYATYLFFNGNCEEALNYYSQHLDCKINRIMRYKDVPQPNIPAEMNDKVMHADVTLQGATMYASDNGSPNKTTFGDNVAMYLDFKNEGDLRRAFDGLSLGGRINMPLEDTFWGALFGMCTDKFGVLWMCSHEKPGTRPQ